MHPKITTKPAFKIMGVMYRGGNHLSEKCVNLWDEFSRRFEEIKTAAKRPIIPFGLHTNIDLENDMLDHTVGIEVQKFITESEDIISYEIPEQEYAVFEGTFSTILETVMSHKDWFKETGYKRSGGPEFFQFDQIYDIGFNPHKTDTSFSFYLPIIK